MKNRQPMQQPHAASFDLFRLSKSKQTVDVCPNTIRAYVKAGLPVYRRGKAAFISRSELHAFITGRLAVLERAA